jgi:hypothetical protein
MSWVRMGEVVMVKISALVMLAAIFAPSAMAAPAASTQPANKTVAVKSINSVKVVKSGVKKSAARRTAHRGRRHSAMLVPPPPAYMPSILPELAVRDSITNGDDPVPEVKKPVNPYKKYIFTRDENDMPTPATVRKGVTTWNRS